MRRTFPVCDFTILVFLSACALTLAAPSFTPTLSAQVTTNQYPPGQYPPGRPQPVVLQCQNALADRISADAGRRVNLNLDTQELYSSPNGRQGVRGRVRYGIGRPNTWRTANYECIVDPSSNRVERANYNPRFSGNWPGGPGGPVGPGYPGYPVGPGYPGGPGGPGIPNYPRVKVDSPMRGLYSSRSVGGVNITRGYVDSRGPTPSITLRGDRDFRITFYGVVERSDGGGFTMRITGSDRGDARGSAQARFNRDLNEVEIIIVSGRVGRDDFSGNFNRR
jgi:hypothetical protein